MLSGEVKQFGPVAESIEPTLWVQVEVRYNAPAEMPVSFDARLRLGGKKNVGGTAQGVFGGSNIALSSISTLVPGAPSAARDRSLRVEFRFPLSQREIDAIQQVRERDPHADIQLTLTIQAQTLELQIRAFPVDFLEQRSTTVGQTHQVIAYHRPQDSGNSGDVLLARGDEMLIRLMTHALVDIGFVIPSSHWVRDYAPAFGVGQFMVVDIPVIDSSAVADGELATRVNAAIQALKRMQEDIRKGEWTQCAEDSRPVLELLNRPALLRPLLKTAGLPEANETALLEGLKQVYTYSHAFHHRVEDGGKVTEAAVNADPEDAYLAFTTTAALLNLVARKLKRHGAASTG
jgi:hypothetical protein